MTKRRLRTHDKLTAPEAVARALSSTTAETQMPAEGITAEQLDELWLIADDGKTMLLTLARWRGAGAEGSVARGADGAKARQSFETWAKAVRGRLATLAALPPASPGERPAVRDAFLATKNEQETLWHIAQETGRYLDRLEVYEKKGTGAADLSLRLQSLSHQHDVLRAMKSRRWLAGVPSVAAAQAEVAAADALPPGPPGKR